MFSYYGIVSLRRETLLRYAEMSKETYLYGKRGLLKFAYLRDGEEGWTTSIQPENSGKVIECVLLL